MNPVEESYMGFPGDFSGKESACQCRRGKRHRFHPWIRKIPWSKKEQPTPEFLLENSMERSLVGLSPWGYKELDKTEHREFLTGETDLLWEG